MSEDTSFLQLMERVRRGDQEAAAELHRTYSEPIQRMIRVRMINCGLRRQLDSSDICQSVFADFFMRMALGQYEFSNPSELIKLLSTMARNRVVHHAQRHSAGIRDVRRVEQASVESFDPASSQETPSVLASVRELVERFQSRLRLRSGFLSNNGDSEKPGTKSPLKRAALGRPSASNTSGPLIESRGNSVWRIPAMAEPLSRFHRLEELCRDQRNRWSRGERALVESYFAREPVLSTDDNLLLDFVYAEYCLREELGDCPTPEEYLTRFPKMAERLRPLLEVHDAVSATRTLVRDPDAPRGPRKRGRGGTFLRSVSCNRPA